MAAFGACAWIDYAVDERRFPSPQGIIESVRQLGGCGGPVARTTECLDEAVMVCGGHQRGRRWVRRDGVGTVAAVDASVVEYDDHDGQPVAADGLQLHARESEGAVAFDGHHRRTG